MSIKDIANEVKKKGLMITFHIGKIFNPALQERNDAVKDLVNQQGNKDKKMLDNLFGPGKKED